MTTAAKKAPRPRLSQEATDALRALVNRHAALTEELDALNPFWAYTEQRRPEIEAELLQVGDELAEAVTEVLEDAL